VTRVSELNAEFVETVPEQLEEGTLYVSMVYGTVVHLCCCGCRSEVVTPLHPTRWVLTFDGLAVSLRPSVGSWALPCRSHYFITQNQVAWQASWTEEEVVSGRRRDAAVVEEFFAAPALGAKVAGSGQPSARSAWWLLPRRWLLRLKRDGDERHS